MKVQSSKVRVHPPLLWTPAHERNNETAETCHHQGPGVTKKDSDNLMFGQGPPEKGTTSLQGTLDVSLIGKLQWNLTSEASRATIVILVSLDH